jgi:hypothetical protein
MPSFPLSPNGYGFKEWRPLRLKDPMQRGWDVFDLQCRFAYLDRGLGLDGWFGPETDGVVRRYQQDRGLAVDGIAGTATQRDLGNRCARRASPDLTLGKRVFGQFEKESSLLCGIYTPAYTSGSAAGSQDRGPVQENSEHWPDTEHAFNVRECLADLVEEIKAQHTRYASQGVPDARAWAAAQGYWNNHVYANRYAISDDPDPKWSDATKDGWPTFLGYVDAVTIYI